MKPEQNPKSPLNAKFMVTIHRGGWIEVAYCGNNENKALQMYRIKREIALGLKHLPGTTRWVIKFWDNRLTVKDGVPYDSKAEDKEPPRLFEGTGDANLLTKS